MGLKCSDGLGAYPLVLRTAAIVWGRFRLGSMSDALRSVMHALDLQVILPG